MLRKLWIGYLIILMLLLQLAIPTFADKSQNEDIEIARKFAANKAGRAQDRIDELNVMMNAMNALIDEWNGNKEAIANGIELTLAGVLGTTASLLSTYFSGGSMGPGTVTAAMLTIKKAIDLGVAISAHGGYVEAMETAINAVANQLGVVKDAIVYYSEVYDDDDKTYNGIYEKYLLKLSTHTGHSVPWIDERVNKHDIDSDTFPHIQIEGKAWTPTHKHFGDERDGFSYEDLPYKYECDGPCQDMFRSPHQALIAHREKCGSGKNVDDEAMEEALKYAGYDLSPDSYPPDNTSILATARVISAELLKGRSVDAGCGRFYYDCPSVPDTEHQVLTCAKNYTYNDANGNKKSESCGDSFRKCMGHTKDHHVSWPGSSKHSIDANAYGAETPPLSTSNGNTGDSESSTPATITYTCGIHSGAASAASDDHSTTISGYSSTFYECQPHQTFGCAHIDLNSNASLHALQASCTSTNANGHSCTVTSFYPCQSPHTHAYPRTCWRSDCNVIVSDAAEHKETCGSGAHSFWPGCPDLNVRSWHQDRYHQLRNCSRCGSQFRLCSNNDNSCSNGGNHRK